MLKQRTENKQLTDSFEGMDGRWYTRADVEDPGRPGHLRPDLVPIEPQIWGAAAHFGLFTPTGRPMAYVEVKPDPREPRREEAPTELRTELEAAQREYDAIAAERQRVIDELGRAEAGIRETTQLAYARRIGENEARQKISESEGTRLSMEERLRELDNFRLPPVRTRLSEAQKRLRWWIDDERLRRAKA